MERKKQNKYNFYTIDEGKLKRIRKYCPKCGPGIFMAQHEDRFSCGKCQYTEMVK